MTIGVSIFGMEFYVFPSGALNLSIISLFILCFVPVFISNNNLSMEKSKYLVCNDLCKVKIHTYKLFRPFNCISQSGLNFHYQNLQCVSDRPCFVLYHQKSTPQTIWEEFRIQHQTWKMEDKDWMFTDFCLTVTMTTNLKTSVSLVPKQGSGNTSNEKNNVNSAIWVLGLAVLIHWN